MWVLVRTTSSENFQYLQLTKDLNITWACFRNVILYLVLELDVTVGQLVAGRLEAGSGLAGKNNKTFEHVCEQTNNLGSDLVRHKQACTVTEDG